MAKNSAKWSEMLRQMVQMRSGIPTPNCLTKKGEILTKNEKFQKIAKMAIQIAKNG